MKAILEFNLDENDDVEAHKRAIKSLDLVLALYDMDQYLRTKTKYAPDSLPGEVYDSLQETRDELYQILSKYNISFDELIS